MIKVWLILSKEELLTLVDSAGSTLSQGLSPTSRQPLLVLRAVGIQESFGFSSGCHFEDQSLLALEDHAGNVVPVALTLQQAP